MRKNPKIQKALFLIMMMLMAAIPTTVWADDPNDETVTIDGVSYHVLRSTEDWGRFRQLVNDAAGNSDVNAIMDADFTVTEWVGLNMDAPFQGTFNGNGHTLNVEIDNPYNDFYMAPFVFAANATICNLHVTGSVSGGKHSAGLVGMVGKTETNCSLTVERVWVSVTVTGNDNSENTGEILGGFIGHARKNSIVMSDCLFDGKIIYSNKKSDKDKYAGAFVGWGEKGASYDVRRLYENGSKDNIDHYSICYYGGDAWGGQDHPCVYTAHNWGECGDHKNFTDQASLVNKMNENKANSWQFVDANAVPVYTNNPTFECYDIVPGTEAGEEGMLKIPFTCDQEVNWIDAWYTDENGNRKDLPRLTLPDNSYSGFLLLPATEAHRDLRMIVKLTPDIIFYTFDAKSDAVMHNPRNLKCDVLTHSKQSLTDAGAVRLQWETKDADYNDIMDGDQFVVLRSLTGKLEDAASIGSVMIENDVTNYEYKDSTLMSTLVAEQIDLATGTAQVGYWVVRATAQQLWGLDAAKNPTVVTVQPTLDKLALLEPTGVKAAWSNQEDHLAKVTWIYKDNDDSHRYVWDDRLSMMLKVNTYNREKQPVDSTITAITADQLRAGEAELLLSRSCVDYQITLLVDAAKTALGKDTIRIDVQVPDDKFYHENTGRIDKESLVVRELQSSVLLTWANVDDEPVDYYEVWRCDANDGKFERIAGDLTEMQFEDKTTSPVHQYKYYVRGVNDCEGKKHEDTKTVAGNCMQTGTVEGYLRFDDGTGVTGVTINVTLEGGQPYTATTDESGFFSISDLPYVGGTETTYSVAPSLNGFSEVQPVTFKTTPGGNVVTDVTFIAKDCIKFSGLVRYKGTSIPVQGVSFLVDGREVRNGSGKVVTDHDGKYSFRILKDQKEHSVQAVKDGHVFSQDGFYHEGDNPSTKYSFTIDMPGIYFYDETRVKLIGRVAGGKDQGSIPLGNSLSCNNLGDDLQLVFALEGDNASRLVWDVQNTDKKELDEEYIHKAHDKKFEYKTKVHTTLNRMVVTPDIHTGEYEVLLPPVKWKIQQITAKGYATLFQSGQVGDVIDLTDSLTLHSDTIEGSWENAEKAPVKKVVVEYNAQYSRIYHSPVIIDYKQIGYEKFDFLGDQYYSYKDVKGNKLRLPLAYGVKKPNWPAGKKDSLETHYTFGYPVFSIDRKYPVKISATERYYYNNNIKSDTVDIVRLSGGEVTIHNGMLSSTHHDVVELDSVGEAIYNLEAAQVPYLLTGKDALRTVTMTLLMDGTHYEAQPLRAYLLNIQQMKGAKEILNYSTPQLVDILRDPPGGTSSATLSKGSTLDYTYQMDMTWKAGTTLKLSNGTASATFIGTVAAPMGAGAVGGLNNDIKSTFDISFDLMWSGSGNRAFKYTMTTNEDISTSNDKTLVGADGDLYIGLDQNIIVKPATAIRAIPDSIFQQMGGQLKSGRMLEIAQGTDGEGNVLHLVRDEVVTYGPVVKSSFIHSQSHIRKHIIPSLLAQCQSLMFTGTKDQAVERANATGEIVYWSKVDKDSLDFGVEYEPIVPSGYSGDKTDQVARYHENMLRWVEMIAQNEREKLSARDLVKNYDVDGGMSVNYGETFTTNYSNTASFVSPMTAATADYFDSTGKDLFSEMTSLVGPTVAKILSKILKGNGGEQGGSHEPKSQDKDNKEVVVKAGYVFMSFNFIPAFDFNVVPRHTETTTHQRTERFSISMDKRSHLNFDVYRVETTKDDVTNGNVFDVFVGSNFTEQAAENYEYLKREMSLDDYRYPRGFVYRTRGGATCRPYEDERKSAFYNPGTVIDERTKKIENPVIKMDKQSISGVPFGEPARFKLYLTNDSEQPEAAYNYFYLYQSEKSNPDGAKMLVDGMPLTGDGRTVEVRPGQVTEKTLEVYASEKFDYDSLKIGILSQGDAMIYQEVAFDVHYLQTAGAVSITTPGDKWIMNCDAPQDGDKGWYMPVIIGGFDKNQHNFDHIEFQYKETTRGDDYWTNLCGYYADSTLYAAASGTKEMIPENGNITTRFFGEGYVMEKAYDLRAVLFCRNGNAFLTHESKVLSGVKDTRRPQLFGTPDPMDGVLGAGENIIFNFSEDIEYNYLREDTNFEVKGETNETELQDAPSLQFDGKGYAQSEARRNFADKNITVEVMVKPDDTGKEMPIFSHGSDGKKLQLWLTADRRLRAVVDDKKVEGVTQLGVETFKRVALVLNNDQQKLILYVDSVEGSLDSVTYNGYGSLIFGATNESDASNRSFFTGHMIQGRIWNRTMDINLLNSYGNQLLTGYEKGLVDYYPMNEGKGEYATDLAQGAHLKLDGTEWAQPNGMSLKLDMNEQKEIKGLQLIDKCFYRTAEQDYTLMFWFKTDEKGHGTLLCNGSGRKTDVAAINKFFIGFEKDSKLKYRSYGQEFVLGDNYSDNRWHHYVMTVNRSRHVASIYVDQELRAQFATDSLGGMTGDFYLGNMVWKEEGKENDKVHQENPLTGYIDGLALFEQALPKTLIKRYSEKALGGSEMGLKTYIDFERQERQQNNEIVLVPYARSKVVKCDMDGNIVDGDSVFVNPIADIMKRIDTEMGAPIQAYEELHNLNFSFVGRDNRILVNIDELEKRINKRTVYATVRDIPDLNGNFMASPATVSMFIDLNPLRWSKKTLTQTIMVGDYDSNFSVNIMNNSGQSHTYQVENLPRWLSVDKSTDIINAQDEQTLTFTISKDANVGTYDNIVYLTDENGLAEPLALNIIVEGQKPQWAVDDALKRFSMNIVARVEINDEIVTDSRDLVSVFDNTGRCLSVGNIDYNASSAESMAYLTVYDSSMVSKPLTFRLWHYDTGRTMVLTPSQAVEFQPEAFVGTTKEPLVLKAGNQMIQHIDLKPGWNWISLNVINNDYRDVKNLLGRFQWHNGDMLTDKNHEISLLYQSGQWISNKGTASLDKMILSVKESYRVSVTQPMTIELIGSTINTEGDRTINVKQGWNSIGYTPLVNLPVTSALADYLDELEDGDVVKSKNEFAMFYQAADGSSEWKGNLKYMKPGEGYMLYRKHAGETSFIYPYFEANTAFFFDFAEQNVKRFNTYNGNMSLVAVADGIELQKGDRLLALAGSEVRGVAEADCDEEEENKPVFYLSIEGDANAALSFALERDGEIIATADNVMTYKTNDIVGSPAMPTSISFVQQEGSVLPHDGWYTLQGVKLNGAPVSKGVYIYDGHKVLIK